MSTRAVDGLSSRERKVGLLVASDFPLHWHGICRALSAIPHFWEFNTEESFLTSALSGRVQVWAVGDETKTDAIFVTDILTYPKMKVFRVIGASGSNVDEYLERLDQVFDGYAEMMGCSRIELIGRPGWLRKMRKSMRNPEFCYVTLSRPLNVPKGVM